MRIIGFLFICISFSFSGEQRFSGLFARSDTAGLSAEHDRILRQLGFSSSFDSQPIEIFFASSQAQFDSLLPGGFPEWGIAAADLQNDRIVVKPGAQSFGILSRRQILIHELTHVLLRRTGGGAYLPRWFHEGLAMTFAGDVAWQEHVTVSKAIFSNQLLSLSDIENVNQFRSAKAELAYAQSHLAVSFLIRHHGPDVLAEIISESRRKRDFWKGVSEVLSISRKEWEKTYQDDLRKQYQWLFLVNDTFLFWILGAVFLIVIFIIKKIQNKKTVQRWGDEEKEEMSQSFQQLHKQ